MITPESIFKIKAVFKAVQELTPEEQEFMTTIMSAFKAGGKPAAVSAMIDGYIGKGEAGSNCGLAASMKNTWNSFSNFSSKPVRCDPDDQ